MKKQSKARKIIRITVISLVIAFFGSILLQFGYNMLFVKPVVGETTKGGDGRLFFPEISGPTIPLPLFPKLGYTLVPRGKNHSYGVAALIFAAIEYKRCLKQMGEI